MGTRNTFAKLRRFATIDEAGPTWRFRAWLVLVAMGYEPAELGLTDDVVPPAYSVPVLLDLLPAHPALPVAA